MTVIHDMLVAFSLVVGLGFAIINLTRPSRPRLAGVFFIPLIAASLAGVHEFLLGGFPWSALVAVGCGFCAVYFQSTNKIATQAEETEDSSGFFS